MTGTQVFDRLADERTSARWDSEDEQALRDLGERMVAGAIASGKMLRRLRDRMFPSDDSSPAMALAKAIQADFLEWVQEADAVYGRALALGQAGYSIANLAELNDLIGLTQAMLQITPEEHVRSIKQGDPGRAISIEELRRELHLQRH